MARVLLGVTGSVAAVRTPALFQAFTAAGHEVKVIATQAALYFFDPKELTQGSGVKGSGDRGNSNGGDCDPEVLILDQDEWPGRAQGRRYRRDDPVLHIELRRWADVLVISPLDANTLAKLAGGLCDNCLTCVWRAWDPARPVVLAPAMNTLMWDHPLTARHLRLLTDAPANLDRDRTIDWINSRIPGMRIVPPQEKELACGDAGMGAMADVEEIVRVTKSVLGRR